MKYTHVSFFTILIILTIFFLMIGSVNAVVINETQTNDNCDESNEILSADNESDYSLNKLILPPVTKDDVKDNIEVLTPSVKIDEEVNIKYCVEYSKNFYFPISIFIPFNKSLEYNNHTVTFQSESDKNNYVDKGIVSEFKQTGFGTDVDINLTGLEFELKRLEWKQSNFQVIVNYKAKESGNFTNYIYMYYLKAFDKPWVQYYNLTDNVIVSQLKSEKELNDTNNTNTTNGNETKLQNSTEKTIENKTQTDTDSTNKTQHSSKKPNFEKQKNVISKKSVKNPIQTVVEKTGNPLLALIMSLIGAFIPIGYRKIK